VDSRPVNQPGWRRHYGALRLDFKKESKRGTMVSYNIEISEDLPAKIEEKMRNGLVAYENDNNVDVNYKKYSIALVDESGEAFGVLNAYTAYAEVYIDDLWVNRSCRGKGYGKKLIRILEDEFNDKGFNNINLVTSAFQAPDFYTKCGFVAEFTRENTHNPKLSKTFFVKYFENSNQTQGTVKRGVSTNHETPTYLADS
jgi:ribosomal protein S18 acetylase RimI-like enzyme